MVRSAQNALRDQVQLVQLSNYAFRYISNYIRESERSEFDVNIPIGLNSDGSTLEGTDRFSGSELLAKYELVGTHQMPLNGIFQIVVIVEAMLGDLVRHLIIAYPNKLGSKRKISMEDVLSANTIEEVHLQAADAYINELSYLSPKEFANTVEDIFTVNMLECPDYHRYIETKATRDIYLHNKGVANSTYRTKTGSHARVPVGSELPVSYRYFLSSYEYAAEMCGWLASMLNKTWPSEDYEENKRQWDAVRTALKEADSSEESSPGKTR